MQQNGCPVLAFPKPHMSWAPPRAVKISASSRSRGAASTSPVFASGRRSSGVGTENVRPGGATDHSRVRVGNLIIWAKRLIPHCFRAPTPHCETPLETFPCSSRPPTTRLSVLFSFYTLISTRSGGRGGVRFSLSPSCWLLSGSSSSTVAHAALTCSKAC